MRFHQYGEVLHQFVVNVAARIRFCPLEGPYEEMKKDCCGRVAQEALCTQVQEKAF